MAITSTDRLTRLVAAIPWIVSQDGAHLDEIAERFDYPRDTLLDDLQNVVFFVGVPPYTPDSLIEVHIDGDLVWIDYADWFARPMKLTSAEALALLAAGETVLGFDSGEEAGALARGLAKLRLAHGGASDALDVELGAAEETVLRSLRHAVDAGVCVDIVYYSLARDERSERRIEPLRFFAEDGHWYVAAWCQRAQADRVFRVDRVQELTVTTVPVAHTEPSTGDAVFGVDDQPRATVHLPAGRRMVFDRLSIDDITDNGDGTVAITLPVTSVRWLERMLLRVGAGARIAVAAPELGEADAAGAAARILDRYR